MKFRETLWFKKGLLDADVASQASEDEPTAVDTLPIEDRYLDDGTVTASDSVQFGLHTGTTRPLPTVYFKRRPRSQ